VAILLAAVPSLGWAAAERLDRARDALHDLARLVAQAEVRGEATLYHHVPLLVARAALAQVDQAQPKARDRLLDAIYETCLRGKLAVLEGREGRRRPPASPPAFALDGLALRDARWHQGDRPVFPVALAPAPAGVPPGFFAAGELVRTIPALAGATPDNLEGTEVFAVYRDDPQARRVGWDRPAGGFVRDASAGRPAVLIATDHPPMREAIARETAKALAAWPPDVRPLYASLGAGFFYTDYSPRRADRFAAWLQARYKTLRVLNAVWETDFDGFGPQLQPTPAQAAAGASRWLDWVTFNHEQLTEHVRWACENVRRLRPGLPLGLSAACYQLAGSFGLSGVDPQALAEAIDVVEARGADAMQADLALALADGRKPVVDPAVGPGPFGVLPHLLHGSAAVGLASWPRVPLVTPEAVAQAEHALRDALDARRLAPVIAALAEAPRPVALLYSPASLRQAPPWALRCAQTPYTRELAAAYEAARFLDVGCGFVVPRGPEGSVVGKAPVIVVAGSPFETLPVARGLIDHVELGSHLVVVPEALVADERGREAEYLLRLGIEILDTARPTYATEPRPERGGALDDLVPSDVPQAAVAPLPEGPLASIGRVLRAVGPRQKIRVNVRHDVLAAFPNGEPAIVSFARAKGRVTYLAMPLEPRDLADVLRVVLRQAKAKPLVRLATAMPGGTWGIECRAVRREGAILVSVWNTTADARRVALETQAAAVATRLATGEALPVQVEDGATVGPLRLAPFETALVHLTTR
jgi:hypothetical protein